MLHAMLWQMSCRAHVWCWEYWEAVGTGLRYRRYASINSGNVSSATQKPVLLGRMGFPARKPQRLADE